MFFFVYYNLPIFVLMHILKNKVKSKGDEAPLLCCVVYNDLPSKKKDILSFMFCDFYFKISRKKSFVLNVIIIRNLL